jgi:APA family basic amino acid/polyamine antiporter
MTQENVERNLKRTVGFLGLLAMCVGINIGGALFALTTVAADLAGPSLPLAMLISSLPVLLAIVPYCALTSVLPTTSATYRYSQLFNPTVAIVSVLTLLVCILIGGQPLYALAFGKYLNHLVPSDPILVGAVVLTAFYLINLLGIRLTAGIQTILFFMLFSALLLYVILGLPRVETANFADLFPKGAGGLLAASGLLFTFSAGGFFVIDLGGETIRATKNFPRVLTLGIGIAVGIYFLITVVTVGVVDWSKLSGESLIVVAQRFMSKPLLAYFIIGGALVACATTINIVFTVVSRGLMIVAAEGLLPGFLGKVNKRFGTPHWGLTISYLVCVVALVSIPSLMFFGSMLNLGIVFCITVVVMAGMVFPKRFPDLFAKSSIRIASGTLKAICWVIVFLNSLIFVFFMIAIGRHSITFMGVVVKPSALFVGIVILNSLYALSRRTVLRKIKDRLSSFKKGESGSEFWMARSIQE